MELRKSQDHPMAEGYTERLHVSNKSSTRRVGLVPAVEFDEGQRSCVKVTGDEEKQHRPCGISDFR
jgi:hypothetical protein